MQFYYGADGNLLRVLDEADFWKQQEAEHTTVTQVVIPELDVRVKEQLKKFEFEFMQTRGKTIQLTETVVRSQGQLNAAMIQHILDVIKSCLKESENWIQFLYALLKMPVVSSDPIRTAFINHIIRESEYFIGIAQTILVSKSLDIFLYKV